MRDAFGPTPMKSPQSAHIIPATHRESLLAISGQLTNEARSVKWNGPLALRGTVEYRDLALT